MKSPTRCIWFMGWAVDESLTTATHTITYAIKIFNYVYIGTKMEYMLQRWNAMESRDRQRPGSGAFLQT